MQFAVQGEIETAKELHAQLGKDIKSEADFETLWSPLWVICVTTDAAAWSRTIDLSIEVSAAHGALDPLTRAEMQTFLRALARKLGKTMLVVTHDLQEALYLADRVVLVDEGSIVASLSSSELLTSPIEAVQAYVRATRPAEVA